MIRRSLRRHFICSNNANDRATRGRLREAGAPRAGTDTSRQIDAVYLTALCRLPTSEEKKLGCEAMKLFTDEWEKQLSAAGKPDRDAAELKAACGLLSRGFELRELSVRGVR